MRANHDALAALDAEILIPYGDDLRDVAFLPLGGGCRERSTGGKSAHRKIVAVAVCDHAEHVANECWGSGRNCGQDFEVGCDGCGDLHLVEVSQGSIDCVKILLYYCVAALAVGLLDVLLDLLDGLFARQYSADGEEACLHDGVDAVAHSGIPRNFVSIDHEEPELLLDDLLPAFCAERAARCLLHCKAN